MKILDGAWKISMLVILSAGIYLTACTKKAQTIGLELRPNSDLVVESTDTTTLIAYSVIQDSLITSNYTRIFLGSMMDPVFGKTTANYFSQLRLQPDFVDFNFGQNPVIDSMILSLEYDGYYGDTTTTQTIRFYELSEKLISDSGYYYYSSDKANYYPTEIGRYTFTPKPNTPVALKEGDTVSPHIRINLMELTDEFGNKFINAPLDIIQSNENFADYIYGFALVSEPVNEAGAMLYFDVTGIQSDLTIYYRNDASTDIVYSMYLYDSTTRFNNFDHNNYVDAAPEFKAQVMEGNVSLGQEKIYVQAMGGIYTKLDFPFIKSLNTIGKLAINSAELTLKAYDENNGNVAPDRLTLVEIDSEGYPSQAIIDAYEGDAYFDGYYDTATNVYKFQIARHIQHLLSDDSTDYGIFLKIYGSASQGGQFILNGTNPLLPTPYDDRLKLKITYTIIE